MTQFEFEGVLSKNYFRAYRYAAYKQYTYWIHNNLGKGVRKMFPSCAVWKIRREYPKINQENYSPFMESAEDEERVMNIYKS